MKGLKYLTFCLSLLAIIALTVRNGIQTLSFRKNHSDQVKNKNTISTSPEYGSFPYVSFYDLRGKQFKPVQNGKSHLIIYFDPDCDFCEEKAKILADYPDEFKDIQILMVSSIEANRIKAFQKKFHLDQYDNIVFLTVNETQFYNQFQTLTIPTLIVYGKSGKQVEKIEAYVGVKTLIKLARASKKL